MELNRRQFVLLTVSTGATACCGGITRASEPGAATVPSTQPALPSNVIDAGPVSVFKTDDVYAGFRDDGFFVIRRNQQLFALSSVCTHKGCKVRVQDDLSFLCKCHGSRFDQNGKVTKGPAPRNLPRLAVAEDNDQHLLVDLQQKLSS